MKRLLYDKQELQATYERLVNRAIFFHKKGFYAKSRVIIERAAKFQYNLNIIYSDSRLNTILKEQSFMAFGTVETYTTTPNSVVFYDSFATDNGGLTQQYIDALLELPQTQVIYVSENPISERGKHIMNVLKENKIVYFEINKGPKSEVELKKIIDRYKPERMFFHISPYTTIPFIVCYAYPHIIKYQINLTDHAFWLGGADFFDKIIEFRDYGAQISIEKRGFAKQQIILLPFYPWQEKTQFAGFPDIKQPILLFSGGATYKISSKSNVYFSIVDKILENNRDVAFLFAGSGNTELIDNYIKESKYADRICYLGFRQDISAVMHHIDIYLNTYPLGGGLMLQLAAISSKPILAMNDGSCESLVCTKKKANFSFEKVGDLVEEASKLIRDAHYREERAEFFHSLIATREDFVVGFKEKCLSNLDNEPASIQYETIDYEGFSDLYLNSINNGQLELFVEQNILRASPLAMNWKMYVNCMVYGISFLMKNIKKKS